MIEITPQNYISTIWGNPYIRVVNNWHSYYHQKQLDLIHGMQRLGVPQGDIGLIMREPSIEGALRELRDTNYYSASTNPTVSTLRCLDRDAKSDPSWWQRYFSPEATRERILSSSYNPVERFVMDHPEVLLGPASLVGTGARTAGALALQRVAPRVLALGSVAPLWENLTNYMKGGKDAVKKPVSSSPAPRIQVTRTDADKYLQGLKDKGVLSKKGVTKDGYDFFKIEKDCEHGCIHFKKGDYISRDRLHHEWEYFSNPRTHKGAIDPITGKLDISKAESARTLKLP